MKLKVEPNCSHEERRHLFAVKSIDEPRCPSYKEAAKGQGKEFACICPSFFGFLACRTTRPRPKIPQFFEERDKDNWNATDSDHVTEDRKTQAT